MRVVLSLAVLSWITVVVFNTLGRILGGPTRIRLKLTLSRL